MYQVNNNAKIPLQQMCNSTRFFCMYGQLYHIQNLEWSDLFLKDSYRKGEPVMKIIDWKLF